MAAIAIQVGFVAGVSLVGGLLAPKPKLPPTDKGRLDDLRVQTAEEGGFLPLLFGERVRLAGNIVWAAPTQEHVTTTPGRGGKGGGGGGSAPPERHFTYTKSFDVALSGNPVRGLRRIWDGVDLIFDQGAATLNAGYYEAEEGALSSAEIVEDEQYSGALAAEIFSGGYVQFADVLEIEPTNAGPFVLYYRAPDGCDVALDTPAGTTNATLPPASNVVAHEIPALAGFGGGFVRVTNTGGDELVLDRLFYFAGFLPPDPDQPPRLTGAINALISFPSDPDAPQARYDQVLAADGAGALPGTLTTGGNVAFTFYQGEETQLADAVESAALGAANTPAYRGVARCVFDAYQLRESGRLDNFVFEVAAGPVKLNEIISYLYRLAGLTPAQLDLAALASLRSQGFVLNQPGLAEPLKALEDWFAFDLLPLDGQIRAVLRGGSSLATIPEEDLFARAEGAEMPAGPVEFIHREALNKPGAVEVTYLDPSDDKEFHTATQRAELDNSLERDTEKLNFPIVSLPDAAHAVAKRLLLAAQQETPVEFSTGPKWAWLAPGDVVTIERANATDEVRLTGKQLDVLTGLIKWKGVTTRASLYTQTGLGVVGQGGEDPPVVYFPANTQAALLDLPPLRLTDDALGFYAAVVPRGAGDWRGARLYKEEANGDWVELAVFNQPAQLGAVVTPLAAVADCTVWDRASTLVVDFYRDVATLQSRPESELLDQPLNVLVVGDEIIQFATAVAGVPAGAFAVRYTFTNLLRGRQNTEWAAALTRDPGETVCYLSDALKFIPEELTELNSSRNYRAVTAPGQALEDAFVTNFYFRGVNSLPPAPAELRAAALDGGGYLVEWTPRSRFAGWLSGTPNPELPTDFEVEIYDGATLRHRLLARADSLQPWLREQIYEEDGNGAPVGVGWWARQRVDVRRSFVEARLENLDLGATPEIYLTRLGADGLSELKAGVDLASGLYVYEQGPGYSNLVYTQGAAYAGGGAARVRLGVENGLVSVWLDYLHNGQLPLYASGLPALAAANVRAKVYLGGDDGLVTGDVIRTPLPSLILPPALLAGNSDPNLKVYQVRLGYGRGRAASLEL